MLSVQGRIYEFSFQFYLIYVHLPSQGLETQLHADKCPSMQFLSNSLHLTFNLFLINLIYRLESVPFLLLLCQGLCHNKMLYE